MKIRAYESFRKKYKSLPLHIQVKVDKQISIFRVVGVHDEVLSNP